MVREYTGDMQLSKQEVEGSQVSSIGSFLAREKESVFFSIGCELEIYVLCEKIIFTQLVLFACS